MAGIPVLLTCSVGMTVRDILPAGKTLEKYGPVYVVDTGCMPGSPFKTRRLTFSETKNTLNFCAACRRHELYYTAHDDVEVRVPTKLVPKRTDGLTYIDYDRFALINSSALALVGGYDETLPQYGADCDLNRRLALSSFPFLDLRLERFVKHIGNRYRNTHASLQRGPDVYGFNGASSPMYVRKWGVSSCNLDGRKPASETTFKALHACSACTFQTLHDFIHSDQ